LEMLLPITDSQPVNRLIRGRTMIIRRAAYARMGLLGNPSDGFGGKTITVQIRDFAATMRLWESPRLEIKPHPVHDPSTFDSLEELRHTAQEDGYYGGTRLLYATCKRFYEHCADSGIPLRDANFTIDYDTDIPRQVGLGGSSAIVVCALRCLMEFYGIGEEQIPLPQQPQLALAVELDELGIRAGLQDRVAQVYGGLVYMDFDEDHMRKYGNGHYERLSIDLLPSLYLAYIPYSTMTSGKAHNPIHFRYENGDADVIAAMRQFAEFAEQGRAAIERGDVSLLGELMNCSSWRAVSVCRRSSRALVARSPGCSPAARTCARSARPSNPAATASSWPPPPATISPPVTEGNPSAESHSAGRNHSCRRCLVMQLQIAIGGWPCCWGGSLSTWRVHQHS